MKETWTWDFTYEAKPREESNSMLQRCNKGKNHLTDSWMYLRRSDNHGSSLVWVENNVTIGEPVTYLG